MHKRAAWLTDLFMNDETTPDGKEGGEFICIAADG